MERGIPDLRGDIRFGARWKLVEGGFASGRSGWRYERCPQLRQVALDHDHRRAPATRRRFAVAVAAMAICMTAWFRGARVAKLRHPTRTDADIVRTTDGCSGFDGDDVGVPTFGLANVAPAFVVGTFIFEHQSLFLVLVVFCLHRGNMHILAAWERCVALLWPLALGPT
jgi:hypothetical protein